MTERDKHQYIRYGAKYSVVEIDYRNGVKGRIPEICQIIGIERTAQPHNPVVKVLVLEGEEKGSVRFLGGGTKAYSPTRTIQVIEHLLDYLLKNNKKLSYI